MDYIWSCLTTPGAAVDYSHHRTQETLALLKILALGNLEIEAGKLKPVAAVVSRLRARKPRA